MRKIWGNSGSQRHASEERKTSSRFSAAPHCWDATKMAIDSRIVHTFGTRHRSNDDAVDIKWFIVYSSTLRTTVDGRQGCQMYTTHTTHYTLTMFVLTKWTNDARRQVKHAAKHFICNAHIESPCLYHHFEDLRCVIHGSLLSHHSNNKDDAT